MGWPKISELRGKFIFILSGGDKKGIIKQNMSKLEQNSIIFVDISAGKVDDL